MCSDDSSDDRCERNWIARPTIIPSLAESKINVTFDPAPNCYHFSAYNVSLVDYNSGIAHRIIQRFTLYHPAHPRNNVRYFRRYIIIVIIIRPPDVSRKDLKFYPWTLFLSFILYQVTVLSSHAVDSHQMYFGGSVVGKALTIGRVISPTPPLT